MAAAGWVSDSENTAVQTGGHVQPQLLGLVKESGLPVTAQHQRILRPVPAQTGDYGFYRAAGSGTVMPGADVQGAG